MKKNVYSLVLSEEVVRAIDACAYREGTNRSALINRILAEYVSYTTPEMRTRRIFDSVSQMLSSSVFRLAEPSDNVLSMRSSLSYKYNPTVRYSVELYRDGDALGALRVSLRTQNETLIAIMHCFYRMFAQVEEEFVGTCECRTAGDKFFRLFRLRSNRMGLDGVLSANDIAALIARYIEMFDRAMKVYFAYADMPEHAFREVAAVYRAYLRGGDEII